VLKVKYRDRFERRQNRAVQVSQRSARGFPSESFYKIGSPAFGIIKRLASLIFNIRIRRLFLFAASLFALGLVSFGAFKLVLVLKELSFSTWVGLFQDTLWTLLRVLFALVVSTLWAVPCGIWLGTSSGRIKIAQPIIQVLASFPAPMLYPLVLGLLFGFGVRFDWASMFLMLLGVQWYVLFNVLAGALRIPKELGYALELMESSNWNKMENALFTQRISYPGQWMGDSSGRSLECKCGC
jgi:NitT/TauT family transport system permease protein